MQEHIDGITREWNAREVECAKRDAEQKERIAELERESERRYGALMTTSRHADEWRGKAQALETRCAELGNAIEVRDRSLERAWRENRELAKSLAVSPTGRLRDEVDELRKSLAEARDLLEQRRERIEALERQLVALGKCASAAEKHAAEVERENDELRERIAASRAVAMIELPPGAKRIGVMLNVETSNPAPAMGA